MTDTAPAPIGRPSKYDPAYCEGVMTPKAAKKVKGRLVYGLCDLDGTVFYVGKTINAEKRIASHAEGRNSNPKMVDRLRMRSDWGVLILRENPDDLDAAEREEIRAREHLGLLNIILSDSSVWDMYKQSPKPWIAKSGKRSPLTISQNYSLPEARKKIKKKLRAMSEAERCTAELAFYSSMDPRLQRRFSTWFSDTIVDMVRCMRKAGIEVSIND